MAKDFKISDNREHTECCSPSHALASKHAEWTDGPNHGIGAPALRVEEHSPSGSSMGTQRMRHLPGGSFMMGTDRDEGFPADGEGPAREIVLSPFYIDIHSVTNEDFGTFVESAGYVTEAERFGWSFVFHRHVPKHLVKSGAVRRVAALAWWLAVDGACWRRPEGRGSNVRKRMDYPVVHVSWNDAAAYAAWADKRLPTEPEWEYAARGGLEGKKYPWGNELTPRGKHMCNIWQGTFPDEDLASDGYAGTCPVDALSPNGYGLYNMAGNVWEWCADWFSQTHHQDADRENPAGPPSGTTRTMKGGSFLCHSSYCNRYRVAARTSNTPDSSAANLGFRCVKSSAAEK